MAFYPWHCLSVDGDLCHSRQWSGGIWYKYSSQIEWDQHIPSAYMFMTNFGALNYLTLYLGFNSRVWNMDQCKNEVVHDHLIELIISQLDIRWWLRAEICPAAQPHQTAGDGHGLTTSRLLILFAKKAFSWFSADVKFHLSSVCVNLPQRFSPITAASDLHR
jgi:hypothetical protein